MKYALYRAYQTDDNFGPEESKQFLGILEAKDLVEAVEYCKKFAMPCITDTMINGGGDPVEVTDGDLRVESIGDKVKEFTVNDNPWPKDLKDFFEWCKEHPGEAWNYPIQDEDTEYDLND